MSTQPSPAQLGALLASTLTMISNARNAEEEQIYQQDMTIYAKIYGTSPNSSAPALPQPPQIEAVNSALVVQLEEANDSNPAHWLEIYSYTTAPTIPLAPPPITLPTIVVQPFGPGFPGYFELAPDSPSIPVGQQVTISENVYFKEVVGENPFAPNGVVTAWLEIGSGAVSVAAKRAALAKKRSLNT